MKLGSCLLLLRLSSAGSAHAFCNQPKLRVNDEYFVSDIVATGTVVGDRKLSNDDSIEADI